MQNHINNSLLTHFEQNSHEEYQSQLLLFNQDHLQLSSYFNLPYLPQDIVSHQNEGNYLSHCPQDSNQPLVQSLQTSKSPKGKQSKNKNLLKFIVKILRDQSETVKDVFGVQYSSQFSQLEKYISKLFIEQRQSPNINSTHLKHLLQDHQEGEPSATSRKVRQALSTILSKKMSKLVTKNNRCCHKLVYLNALKVYQLRCRSAKTALRLQSSF